MKEYCLEYNTIENKSHFYIYGASDVAKSLWYCLTDEPFNKTIEAFLVTDVTKEKDDSIYGIPVINYEEANLEFPVLVATMEKYCNEIIENLESIGVTEYYLVTFESKLGESIRKKKYFYLMERSGLNVSELADLCKSTISYVDGKNVMIYVAKSDVDKPIKSSITNKKWEKDIQVGAALTDKMIASVRDDSGDNISSKNRQYCEMTALYWMWKNASYNYIGLSHYRRRFDIDDFAFSVVINGDVDFILTVPIFNIPDVKANFEKNHVAEDWRIFKKGVIELFPEYESTFEELENGKMYYPYNMFITRKEIMDKYCEWAFNIYEYCEKNFTKKEAGYQFRDIGFLSERVMTLYLLHHKNDFKIAIADKVFYE